MKYEKAFAEVVSFDDYVNMLTRSQDPLGHWFSNTWASCAYVTADLGDNGVYWIHCHTVTHTDGHVASTGSISCPSYEAQ